VGISYDRVQDLIIVVSVYVCSAITPKSVWGHRDLNISDKDIADLAYSELSPHLKEKLESYAFSNVNQVLQRAMDYETRAKEFRNFTMSCDKPRNARVTLP
jgi:hypothetical protein